MQRTVLAAALLFASAWAHFPGSRILDSEMGESLIKLGEFGPTATWKLCFSSFHNDSSTADTFHELCDQYDNTLTVVTNSFNGSSRIFGGWAEGSWNYANCCDRGGLCSTLGCADVTSTGNFIFGLKPKLSVWRPNGKKTPVFYQEVNVALTPYSPSGFDWPKWGGPRGDLVLGSKYGGALGAMAGCGPGDTYNVNPHEVCGGGWADGACHTGSPGAQNCDTWSPTHMEVWHKIDAPPQRHFDLTAFDGKAPYKLHSESHPVMGAESSSSPVLV